MTAVFQATLVGVTFLVAGQTGSSRALQVQPSVLVRPGFDELAPVNSRVYAQPDFGNDVATPLSAVLTNENGEQTVELSQSCTPDETSCVSMGTLAGLEDGQLPSLRVEAEDEAVADGSSSFRVGDELDEVAPDRVALRMSSLYYTYPGQQQPESYRATVQIPGTLDAEVALVELSERSGDDLVPRAFRVPFSGGQTDFVLSALFLDTTEREVCLVVTLHDLAGNQTTVDDDEACFDLAPENADDTSPPPLGCSHSTSADQQVPLFAFVLAGLIPVYVRRRRGR